MRNNMKTLAQIRKEYLENEDSNDHAGNCCLLAEAFGNESERFICEANLSFRNRFGYANHHFSQAAYYATKVYIPNIYRQGI